MVWIDQGFYMANGLNMSDGKWSELNRILTWHMLWIDQDFFSSLKMIELIRVCKWKIVCIDLDFYMENGLNRSEFLHGKWSDLIRGFTWQAPYFWEVEDFGGCSNLRESTHRRFTFMYCTADEVDLIMEIQEWQKYRF